MSTERYKTPIQEDRLDIKPGLTGRQFEILTSAYHNGYFSSPSEIDQRELGEEFGVTQPTITKHIRRSVEKIVSEYVEEAEERRRCPLCRKSIYDVRGRRMLIEHLPECEGET